MVTAEGTRRLADWLEEHPVRPHDASVYVPIPDTEAYTDEEWARHFSSWFPGGVEAHDNGATWRLTGSIGGWQVWTVVSSKVFVAGREIQPMPGVRVKA